MVECLAELVPADVLAIVGYFPTPMLGCACGSCVDAAAFTGRPSLHPACRCSHCARAGQIPEHYLRVCETHGARYTVHQSEPDLCQGCLGFSEEESDAVLPDLSAAC